MMMVRCCRPLLQLQLSSVKQSSKAARCRLRPRPQHVSFNSNDTSSAAAAAWLSTSSVSDSQQLVTTCQTTEYEGWHHDFPVAKRDCWPNHQPPLSSTLTARTTRKITHTASSSHSYAHFSSSPQYEYGEVADEEATTKFAARHAASNTMAFTAMPTAMGEKLSVSTVGYGSLWEGVPAEQSKEVTSAIRHGCNLIELPPPPASAESAEYGEERDTERMHSVHPSPRDYPKARLRAQGVSGSCCETRSIRYLVREKEVQREELVLFGRVPSAGLPVRVALSADRVDGQLAALQNYHDVDIDLLLCEVPPHPTASSHPPSSPMTSSSSSSSSSSLSSSSAESCTDLDEALVEYRAELRNAVEVLFAGRMKAKGVERGNADEEDDIITTVGLFWESINPHVPYSTSTSTSTSRALSMDSPLMDVIAARDAVAPGLPIVIMYPVGFDMASSQAAAVLTSTSTLTSTSGIVDRPKGNRGIYSLPPELGIFQIGSKVLHTSSSSSPFRLVDCPNLQIDKEAVDRLRDCFNKVIHMELQYRARFDGWADLPSSTELSWGQKIAATMNDIEGLDDWHMLESKVIIPSLDVAEGQLRRSTASGEWFSLYKVVLLDLLSAFGETLYVHKNAMLAQVVNKMEGLSPALHDVKGGVMGKCVTAALSTGVDCVLAPEYAAAGRGGGAVKQAVLSEDDTAKLFANFRLPSQIGEPKQLTS